MAGDVGITIKNDEIMDSPVQHKALFILSWIFLRIAEYASGGFGHIGSARGEGRVSPRTPKLFPQDLVRKDSARASLLFCRLLSRALVNEFLKFLSGFEIRNPLGGNVDRSAGLRISTSARASLANPEAAEDRRFGRHS